MYFCVDSGNQCKRAYGKPVVQTVVCMFCIFTNSSSGRREKIRDLAPSGNLYGNVLVTAWGAGGCLYGNVLAAPCFKKIPIYTYLYIYILAKTTKW